MLRMACVVALGLLVGGCGDSKHSPADPVPCSDPAECEGFCGVPNDTPIGTRGLIGTCVEISDEDTGCIVILSGGQAMAEVCY